MKKHSSASKKNRARTIHQIQNRAAMLGISLVVCVLLIVLMVEGQFLQKKIDENIERQTELQEQLEAEAARTEEIEELQEYMKSDEYIEKIAREKIGLVKENEIIFKENN